MNERPPRSVPLSPAMALSASRHRVPGRDLASRLRLFCVADFQHTGSSSRLLLHKSSRLVGPAWRIVASLRDSICSTCAQPLTNDSMSTRRSSRRMHMLRREMECEISLERFWGTQSQRVFAPGHLRNSPGSHWNCSRLDQTRVPHVGNLLHPLESQVAGVSLCGGERKDDSLHRSS